MTPKTAENSALHHIKNNILTYIQIESSYFSILIMCHNINSLCTVFVDQIISLAELDFFKIHLQTWNSSVYNSCHVYTANISLRFFIYLKYCI